MAAVREPTDLVSSPPNQKRHSGRVHDFGHTGNPKPPEQSKTYRTIPLKPPTPRFFRIPDFCSPQHTSQYMCVFLLKSGKPSPSKLVRYAKSQWPKIRTFGTPRKFSSYVSSVFHQFSTMFFQVFHHFSPSLVGLPTLETPPHAHAVCAVPLAPWPPVSPYGDPGA